MAAQKHQARIHEGSKLICPQGYLEGSNRKAQGFHHQ